MKKIGAFLLVLVLLMPTIGLACDCCSNEAMPSHQAELSNTSHYCCSAVDFNRDSCTIEKQDQAISDFSQTSYLGTLLNVPVLWIQAVHEFSLSLLDTGPSLFSSKIPLYLANQVLRF